MKKFLLSAMLSFSLISPVMAEGEPKETKKVCIDVKDKDGKVVKDPKTGNPKQNCKTMKVHQKLDGTKVPDKK